MDVALGPAAALVRGQGLAQERLGILPVDQRHELVVGVRRLVLRAHVRQRRLVGALPHDHPAAHHRRCGRRQRQ